MPTCFERNQMILTSRFLIRWKFWLFFAIPLICSPILGATKMSPEGRCAYVLVVVGLFWILNIIPLPIASMLPIVMCPLLGILNSEETCQMYMKEVIMLLLGCMCMAVCIEQCNLHRRLALESLKVLGTTPRWLLLGFMLPSMFLSMWINNTSACAMMIPIVEGVLTEVHTDNDEQRSEFLHDSTDRHDLEDRRGSSQQKNLRLRGMIMLGVAQSCNLGGTGTLTGTGTNLVLTSIMEVYYGQRVNLTYFNWMVYNVPIMVVCVVIAWINLQMVFFGFTYPFKRQAHYDNRAAIRRIIHEKYLSLGPTTYYEITVITLFSALVLLWMFRDTGFATQSGWMYLFYPNVLIKDSAAVILVLILLYVCPVRYDAWCWHIKDPRKDRPPMRALSWPIMQSKMSWGILLLLGGGLAISQARNKSGLSSYLVRLQTGLVDAPLMSMVLVVMLFTVFLTSLTSNVATAVILIPELIQLSEAVKKHPLYFTLPCTLCCSYAFVLPISTPANAIVYERGNLRIVDMFLSGFLLAIYCIIISLLCALYFAPYVFNMENEMYNIHPET